jgi:hypothetical protein
MRQPDLSRVLRQVTAIAAALGITFMFVSLWLMFTQPNAISIWVQYAGITVVISGMALYLAQLRWPPIVTGHADWSDHFAETAGGEYCKSCKMPRLNHVHVWDGCVCRSCPEIRDEEHDWVGCYCRKCQRGRAAGHVPAACGVCRLCHNPMVALRLVRHEFEDLPDYYDTRQFPRVRQVAPLWMADSEIAQKKCKHCDLVVIHGD